MSANAAPMSTASRHQHTLGVAAGVGLTVVLLVLAAANVFAFQVVPKRFPELWGGYGVAPSAWLIAAVLLMLVARSRPRLPVQSEFEASKVLQLAALVGFYLVASQLLVGVFAGFGRSPLDHSPRWLAINAFFALSPLIAIEAARLAILRILGRRNLSAGLAIAAVILGLAAQPVARFAVDGFPAQAEFWAATFIPLVAAGLIAGIYSAYGGLGASLLVTMPLAAFLAMSPVLPDAAWPVMALVGVAGPATALWISESLFAPEAQAAVEQPTGFLARIGSPSVGWAVTAVVALGFFWFAFGFFGYKPAFIPSESMVPLLNRGDAVLIGPVNPDSIEVGDILLYELGPHAQVLHRVIGIHEQANGQREFIFKGDANPTDDLLPVTEAQIEGRLIASVPRVGWLPLKVSRWLGAKR